MSGFGLRLPPAKGARTISGKTSEAFKSEHGRDGAKTNAKGAPTEKFGPALGGGPTKEEQAIQEQALEDDPDAFDYDKYYEHKQQQAQQRRRDQLFSSGQTAPKYVNAMMEAARQRQMEREGARLHANRQRTQAGGDDKVFVTGSYQRRLDEMRQRGVDIETSNREEGKEGSSQKPLHLPAFYSNVLASKLDRGREHMHQRPNDSSRPSRARPRPRSRSPDTRR